MSRTIYILVPPLHYLLLFIHTTSPHIYTLSLHDALPIYLAHRDHADVEAVDPHDGLVALVVVVVPGPVDRKSTRLNSSHTVNSYAVFCLKKKKRCMLRTIAE